MWRASPAMPQIANRHEGGGDGLGLSKDLRMEAAYPSGTPMGSVTGGEAKTSRTSTTRGRDRSSKRMATTADSGHAPARPHERGEDAPGTHWKYPSTHDEINRVTIGGGHRCGYCRLALRRGQTLTDDLRSEGAGRPCRPKDGDECQGEQDQPPAPSLSSSVQRRQPAVERAVGERVRRPGFRANSAKRKPSRRWMS
jgi:hypothetical protein